MPDNSKSSTWFVCGSTVVFGAWMALIVATVTNGPSGRAPAAATTSATASVQPGVGLAGPRADHRDRSAESAPTFTHVRLSQTTRRGLFAGHGEPNAHIVLLRAGKALADTRANAGGDWQIATAITQIYGHHVFAVEQRGQSGVFITGDQIQLHVPAEFGRAINVTRDGPRAAFQLVAVRAEGEDLGSAASRKFDQFFETKPGAEGTERRPREVAQLGDDILDPAWTWLRDASRSYHDEVVPRIKRGGGYDLDNGVVRKSEPARRVEQPQRRVAQRRADDQRTVRVPTWGDGEGSWMPPGIGDWLAAAQRGYTTEIVPRLSGEVPAMIVARRPDDDARDDAEDERRRRERERSATEKAEQERLDAARRRRDAERGRLEAEAEARRIAEERRQSELEEARKIAAERKRVLARRAEQQRLAKAEKEAEERRRQAREAELARQQDAAEKAALERQRQADREADEAERERKRLAELDLRRREQAREAEAERRERLIEEAAAIKRRQAEARLRNRAERERRFEEQRAQAERERVEARRRAREEAERARRLAQERAEQAERQRVEAFERAAARQRALAAERRRRERQLVREETRPALPAQRPQVIAQRRDDLNRFNRRDTEIKFSVDERAATDESVREARPRSRAKASIKRRVAALRKRARKPRRRAVRSYRRRIAQMRKSTLRCGRKAGRRIKPPGTYIVKPGDSLWRIAKRHYRLGRYYKIIRRANARKIRRARMIYPCQRLHLPRKRRA